MNIDEYKELMKFHILCHKVGFNANFISVDEDGMLWWYKDKPVLNIGAGIWSNSSIGYGSGDESAGGFVCLMSIPDDWEQTLIEL